MFISCSQDTPPEINLRHGNQTVLVLAGLSEPLVQGNYVFFPPLSITVFTAAVADYFVLE